MQEIFDKTLSSIGFEGKILLAVSGGVDSMCMAYLFLHSKLTGIREGFEIAHCNFQLRGEESEGDERMVKEWCSSNRVPFHSKRFDTVGYAKDNGISIEMAARELRYEWFESLATLGEFDAVAVAHNANDNAETMLLNLVRGTGLRGITGMEVVSPLPVSSPNGMLLIRPLLQIPRKEILACAEKNGIPYREDKTNLSDEYKRNRIRHKVIPVLEELNPSLLATLASDMLHFREADSITDDYFFSALERILEKDKDSDKIYGRTAMTIKRDLLAKERFRHFILHRLMTPCGFTPSQIDSLDRLVGENADVTFSGKTFIAEGGRVVTGKNIIIIYRYSPASFRKKDTAPESQNEEGSVEMDITGPGEYSLDGVRFKVEELPWKKSMSPKQSEGVIIMDQDKTGFPLHLRHWQDGDWMKPLGMKGKKKKLSDLFVDLGYSLPMKDDAIIVSGPDIAVTSEANEDQTIVPDSQVIALLGSRISEDVKVSSATKSIIKITLLDRFK
ncbi:MAG: tRNA lysidine(34) synthetase TilS [Bacteroidales bacterium]|nr:tRNA lysidine(34) synthetase TilS [Bacteroidales bacterium]